MPFAHRIEISERAIAPHELDRPGPHAAVGLHHHFGIFDEAHQGPVGLGRRDQELPDAGADQADGHVQRRPLADERDPRRRALRLIEYQRRTGLGQRLLQLQQARGLVRWALARTESSRRNENLVSCLGAVAGGSEKVTAKRTRYPTGQLFRIARQSASTP